MPDDDIISHGLPPLNVVVRSQGIPGPAPFRMSAGEEIRQLATRYIQNPDSRVDSVRVKHSRRSGKVKVMILLELDDLRIAPGPLQPEYYPPLVPVYVCLSLYPVYKQLF
jgi:hypothetical protein